MAGRRVVKMFSDEQIERANRVDVVDYVKSLGYEMERSGNWYKAKGQGGLYFNRPANTWHWQTQDVGGSGAISLCMKLEDKTWKDAVKTLLGEEMNEIRHAADWKPEPETPKEFKLPPQNDTYRHVFAYLIKTRGIDEGIIKSMVDKKLIYENTQKSCVFVGRDAEGEARHASVRSTNTSGKAFKQDVTGSQKQFSFSLSGTSGTLNVCEAPIDVLSYMTLQKMHGLDMNDSYLALGGVSDKALERFLEEYPDIEKIRVCTDNDLAGEGAASRIYEKYHELCKVTRHRPSHKDFNEDLVSLKYPERMKAQEKDIEKQSKEQSRNEMKPGEQTDKVNESAKIPELNQEALQGMDEKAIKWYQAAEKDIDGMLTVKGSCNLLMICESQEEIIAHANGKMRFFEAYGEDYIPDEHYAIYNGKEHLQTYLSRNPKIDNVFVCTSRTEAGEQIAKDISAVCNQIKMNCVRKPPQLTTYADDLTEMKAVSQALEQTPMSNLQELDMAAGMEM